MKNLPPTPAETLERAQAAARQQGLHHINIGNLSLPDSENTYCPVCGQLLIERRGFTVLKNIITDGKCSCGKDIIGIWQ